MEKICCKEIIEKVTEIKQKSGRKFSNYLPLIGHEKDELFDGYLGNNTIIFFTKENIIQRVVFFSSDQEELVQMLKCCPKGMGLDCASTKAAIDDDVILEGGFHKIAVLQRLVFPDATMSESELLQNEKLRAVYENRNDEIVEYAQEGDEKEILIMLKGIFNIYIDHLPTEEEILNKFIKKNGMLVYRENNKILAMVGYLLNGTRMFWVYAINNSGDYKKMSALVVKLRDIALQNNVKHMHGFLELSKTRERALKYYKRRNTHFEDFYNHVYANVDIEGE